MRDDGTTLSDDIHELYVYKVQSLAVSHPAETTLTHGSQLGGFHWAGQTIQGNVLVETAGQLWAVFCLLNEVSFLP